MLRLLAPQRPRGSWSDWIRCWELLRFGSATKTNARRSVANKTHDHKKRLEAKSALKYPPVVLNGVQARAVARGFARACSEVGYVIYACAIMPDHIHLVVARHDRLIEIVVRHLKARATQQLNIENIAPETESPWARGTGWVVYLDSIGDIQRSIDYVNDNPMRDGLKPQQWNLVTPFPV